MTFQIAAEKRTAMGRQSKQVMETGFIPGVVYGHGVEPMPIQVKRADFRGVFKQAGKSSLIDLAVDGKAVKTLVKEVQVHPISLDPVHIDFHQINMNEELTTAVPLRFTGESKAVKELAGTLITSLHSVTVTCLPANLPHDIEVDISALETFDDSISVASLKLPAGVTVVDEPTATIATVAAPLTEDQLKKLEESTVGDVTTIKTEAEEKKAAEEAKKAEEAAAAEAAK